MKMKKMYEVDVLVTGTRREIYHIIAESQEAAVEQAIEGLSSLQGWLVNDNYQPEDHARELYEASELNLLLNPCSAKKRA